MNVDNLDPCPKFRENFRRDRQIFVPAVADCYALCTFQGIVLDVGLTNNLWRRFNDHLNDVDKTSTTKFGRAFFYYWIECDEVERMERTWLNKCEIVDRVLPIFNRVSSPLSI